MKTKLLLILFVGCLGYATPVDPPKNSTSTESVQTDLEKKGADVKAAEEKAKKETDEKAKKEDEAKAAEKNDGNIRVMPPISEMTIQIVSIFFFVVMLFLFYYFFDHIRRNRQRIGFQSIKLIGLILMFPGICIIALVGNGLIGGSTLAALLGTIAGYVLSREEDNKDSSGSTALKTAQENVEAILTEMATKFTKAEIDTMKKKLNIEVI